MNSATTIRMGTCLEEQVPRIPLSAPRSPLTHLCSTPAWPELEITVGNYCFSYSLCPASRRPRELLAWPGPHPRGRGSATQVTWAEDTFDTRMGERGPSEVLVSQNLPEEKK